MLRSYQVLFILTATLLFLHCSNADIRKDCRRESKVSWGKGYLINSREIGNILTFLTFTAALKRMRSGDFEQDDRKLKCYVMCFLKRSGILNSKADVDLQRALRYIPRSMHESSKKLFNTCKVPQMEPCDRAFEMVKCYVMHKPEILTKVPFL
ncbi:general odorant-binding protein 56d-like isoform X2 [Ceratina calcarata]|uniref:General odorant-binding protein 56d-like isoform X2 n=1 Tax=Ceratina calcarata TaxID=156304 RepID=A0AAJ7SA87_9HYME|nr:general odorant-binding protein 56d-like isoform X2 [Ceratina calcarata]